MLLSRLKLEADCCATVSIVYATAASALHITEPKYTFQDMVTSISGNIEAWIGFSAAQAYVFFEQLYDALLGAQLISPLQLTSRLNELLALRLRLRPKLASCCSPLAWAAPLLGCPSRRLISILTKLKVKLTQLFAYLSRWCWRWRWRWRWRKANSTSGKAAASAS